MGRGENGQRKRSGEGERGRGGEEEEEEREEGKEKKGRGEKEGKKRMEGVGYTASLHMLMSWSKYSNNPTPPSCFFATTLICSVLSSPLLPLLLLFGSSYPLHDLLSLLLTWQVRGVA